VGDEVEVTLRGVLTNYDPEIGHWTLRGCSVEGHVPWEYALHWGTTFTPVAAGVDREDTEHGDKPCEADYSGYCPTCKRDSRDIGQADEPQRDPWCRCDGTQHFPHHDKAGAGQVVPQQPTCEHGWIAAHNIGPVPPHFCPGPVGQDTTKEQQQ
jgi:hypothetical protein